MHNIEPRIARFITKFTITEIKDLFKNSKSVMRNPGLDISLSPSKKNYSRILIITPKKIGNAPFRNLIKRRIKSIFYENELYKKNKDMIIFCRKDIEKIDYSNLKNLIITASSYDK